MRNRLLRPHQPIRIGLHLLVPPGAVIEGLGAGAENLGDAALSPDRRHDGPERIVIAGADADQDPHGVNGGKSRGIGSSAAACRPLLAALFWRRGSEGETRVIVIGRGSVQQEECDVMGHMNVRHYVARACDALQWLLLEAGLPPSAGGYRLHDQHIRFLREMPPGTPFTILGGVLEQRGRVLRTLVEIRNSATGEPTATLVSDIEPEGRLHSLDALGVALPDHAAPRGLAFDDPRPVPDLAAALAMGLAEAHRGVVRPEDCNAQGVMRPEGVIARVWDGVPNLRNGGKGLGVKE